MSFFFSLNSYEKRVFIGENINLSDFFLIVTDMLRTHLKSDFIPKIFNLTMIGMPFSQRSILS